ncbi:MAG: SLC13 family permease [Myxococcales bacterium]|nr:SLC13 family permease [Myxococcales bacterium]
MRVALLVTFALSYVGITARRLRWLPVGRPAMALIGATVCVALGVWAGPPYLGVDDALKAIELHTLSLLLGMMIVAAGLGEAGFFAWATRWLSAKVKTRPALLWAVTIGCGLLSAALVNDAVCLLATPLVVQLAKTSRAQVKPFLFAVAMGSNAGSALTLAGNPHAGGEAVGADVPRLPGRRGDSGARGAARHRRAAALLLSEGTRARDTR